MKRFKISNRLNYTILGVVLVIALGAFVYAYGTNNPSNFGHTGGEISGARVSGWERVAQATGAPCGTITATCPSGKIAVGGGCSYGSQASYQRVIRASYPTSSGNGWTCSFDNNGATTGCEAYAVCVNSE